MSSGIRNLIRRALRNCRLRSDSLAEEIIMPARPDESLLDALLAIAALAVAIIAIAAIGVML